MYNVTKFTDKFLDTVKVTESLIKLKPMTSSGSLYKINALNNIKENVVSLKFIVGLVTEGVKNTQDIAVQDFVELIKTAINENKHAFTIGYLYESICDSTDVVSVNVSESIDKVIYEGEDSIGVSVLTGELSKFKSYFSDLKNIENSVIAENIKNMDSISTNEFSIYSPMSYVFEENGNKFVRVENNIFAITENSVISTQAPNQKFINLSESSKEIQFNISEGRGEIETALGTLVIEDSELKRFVGGVEVVETKESLINTFSSSVSNHKINKSEINKLDNIIAVVENINDYKVLENFKVIKNNITKEVALIAEHNGLIFGGVLESTKTFKNFNTYNTINECVIFIKNTIGVDVSSFYETKINKEINETATKNEILSKIDNDIKVLESKKDLIIESLKTTTEGSDANNRYIELEIKISESIIECIKNRKLIVEGKQLPKFKKGDTVYSNIKISGYDNKKPLIVDTVSFEKESSLLGEETKSEWYYTFKDSNWKLVETDLVDSIKESDLELNEAGDNDADKYKEFFNKMLEKYNIKSPSELKDADKSKFYDEVDKGWKSDDEEDGIDETKTNKTNKMKNIFLNKTEGTLKTKDNEELSYRVYSDGRVKIEGFNMRQDFENTTDALNYINSKKIS